MKIQCVQEKLEEGLSKAVKVTGKNLTLPILENILLEVTQEELLITATNLDVGVEVRIPGKVSDTGKVVVPGAVMQSLIQNTQDSTITLETQENVLLVVSKSAETKIKTVPHDDFPSIPRVDNMEAFSIPLDHLLTGLKSVWYAASPSSMKPELSSVYMTHGDTELVFVATDSFRLAEKKIKRKQHYEGPDVLLPVRNCIDCVKMLEGSKGDVSIAVSDGQVSFTVDGVYITSRVVDGNFPDYEKIIPKEFFTHVKVLQKDLLFALKTTHIFSDTFHKISVNIDSPHKKFTLATKNNDVGENTTHVTSTISGDSISMNFNQKYITDCFQSISDDSVDLAFSGEGKPLVITGVSDKTFLYLAMPMSS